MTALRIAGGAVYDPQHDIHGDVRDVCILGDRVVADVPATARVIDARGMIVMPGGVDMHAHVAGGSVNLARRQLPGGHRGAGRPDLDDGTQGRSGVDGVVPSTFCTGYRYAGLGYTTVFDAAVAPVMARLAHLEFDDTPIVDGGFYVLAGNDRHLLDLVDRGEEAEAREFLGWLVGVTGAYALKAVNPGGIELWKQGHRERTSLDTPVGSSRVTPRRLLQVLADAGETLALPHPVHVHGNNLGLPGNVETTLESLRALDGRRAHFTHLQFHSYATSAARPWQSGAREVAEYLNAHPTLSGDVGQVLFGPAATITADGPVEYLLHRSSGGTWSNLDIELETGCGVVPLVYADRKAVSALQWVVGLELFLLSEDPWRMVLSTDHPNGGSFTAYPELIRLLMDRTYRDACLRRLNPRHLAGSALADGLTREYTLSEIAIITRAGPARLLGLAHKGHLAPGADADVAVYQPGAHAAETFATPRYVVKAGVLVVEEGQLRRAPAGRRLHVRPEFDPAALAGVRRHLARYGTVRFEHYGADALADAPCPLAGRP